MRSRTTLRAQARALAAATLATCALGAVLACNSFIGTDSGSGSGSTTPPVTADDGGNDGMETVVGPMADGAIGDTGAPPDAAPPLGCTVGITATSVCDDFEALSVRPFWALGSPRPTVATGMPWAGLRSLDSAVTGAGQASTALVTLPHAKSYTVDLHFRTSATGNGDPAFAFDIFRVMQANVVVATLGVSNSDVSESIGGMAPIAATSTASDGEWHLLHVEIATTGTVTFTVDTTTLKMLTGTISSDPVGFQLGVVGATDSLPHDTWFDNVSIVAK